MPCVDLAAADRHLLGRDVRLGELLGHRLRRPAGEKAHLQPLGVVGDVAERVALDHVGQLVARPHDHADLDPEVLGDPPLELLRDLPGRLARGVHDVAALQQRAHVLVAEPGQQLPELGHLDPIAAAEVDAAQQGDTARHAVTPS